MAFLRGHGLKVDLPSSWEGIIYRRFDSSGASTRAVLHAGNFALPPRRGDFGSGAVDIMGPRHALTVLLEHDPRSAGTPLFAQQSLPEFTPDDFDPRALQRVIPGQAGAQRFFSRNGRAFVLYVVLGSYAMRRSLVPLTNSVVHSLGIDPPGVTT